MCLPTGAQTAKADRARHDRKTFAQTPTYQLSPHRHESQGFDGSLRQGNVSGAQWIVNRSCDLIRL
jgi:hypothetical protein